MPKMKSVIFPAWNDPTLFALFKLSAGECHSSDCSASDPAPDASAYRSHFWRYRAAPFCQNDAVSKLVSGDDFHGQQGPARWPLQTVPTGRSGQGADGSNGSGATLGLPPSEPLAGNMGCFTGIPNRGL